MERTDGHGRAVATELAERGATVLLHGRDDSRGRQVVDDIAAGTGNERLHWYRLTRRMVPRLCECAPARIVNVASAGQAPIDFGDVMLEHDYDGTRAYAQSKLAQTPISMP